MNEHVETVESLNDKIEVVRRAQRGYPDHSEIHRDLLEEELRLLKEKQKVLHKQN